MITYSLSSQYKRTALNCSELKTSFARRYWTHKLSDFKQLQFKALIWIEVSFFFLKEDKEPTQNIIKKNTSTKVAINKIIFCTTFNIHIYFSMSKNITKKLKIVLTYIIYTQYIYDIFHTKMKYLSLEFGTL